VVPLRDVAEAFTALESGGAMKVLVDIGSAAGEEPTREPV